MVCISAWWVVQRDRLLGKSTPDKDLDLVVEGEGSWPAIQLLELIENQELPEGFQLKQSQSFEAFGTAQLHSTPQQAKCSVT